MTEFNVKGEVFNLPTIETDVVNMRDLLENRKSLIRSRILTIISDPNNSNYIFDNDLHTALTDESVSLDTVFKAYRVEPTYELTEVAIPAYVVDTSSTITISSTVTLEIPIDVNTIDYSAVVTKTTNTIDTTDFTALTTDEKSVIQAAYKSSYIATIAYDLTTNQGVSITVGDLENATIDIELFDDGSGGVQVNFKVTDIPGSSSALLEKVQAAIVAVNANGELAAKVKTEIPAKATEQSTVMVGVSLGNIPATSDVFIALSKIDAGGIEVDLPNLNSLLSKSVGDMSESEQYIVKEAYARSYIDKASENGVVLSRSNLVIYLINGSVKVVIKVQNIEVTNTTFAQQVEDFFATTSEASTNPVTPAIISAACLEIINEIVTGQDNNAPPAVQAALDDPNSTLNTELTTFFESDDFVTAVQTSSVENVTITISADGAVEAFVIPILTGGVGKGIKKLPNKDSSMFVDEKRRNAIERGRFNNSIGGHEKISISYRVQRSALRRVRSSGYRTHAKKYTHAG